MPAVDNKIVEFCQQAIENMPEFALGTAVIDGVEHRVFPNGPPTLGALYAHAAQQFGDIDFVVYGAERQSFSDIDALSRHCAGALQAHGVKPGEPVAIAMRNLPEWIVAYMAITRMGAIAVPMNGWWQTEELDYAFGDCKAKLVFADPQRAARILPIADKHGLSVVCVRGDVDGATAWDAFLAGGDASPTLTQPDTDAIGTIFYTSGSTGNPKGVMTSHRATLSALMTWALLSTADRTVRGKGPAEGQQFGVLMTVPLFHVTGCNAMFLLSLLAGQKIVLMDRWDADKAVELIAAERITAFNGVPSMSYELALAAAKSDADVSSLYAISGGGAARPESHVPLLAKTFENVLPSVGYGLTETSALGTANAGNNYQLKPDSAGIPCYPLVELRIVDADGNDCAVGEPGEIWLKSAANMAGYLNNPEETKKVLKDGYLASGDVGYVDEDGYLFIVDRLKDIVIRGGENISCQEVENALHKHDAIREAAVFGLPDDDLGEKLVAVVCVSDNKVSAADLQQFLKDRIAYYKVPVSIEVRSEPLPRTATAKIFKRGLREAALEAS